MTKSRHDMKVVSTGPVTAVSASNPQLEQLDYRGRAVSPILHRREMLKWMGACGTLWMAGCDPVEDEPEIEAADGSFARPFTLDDPGEKPDVHLPVLYAAEISDSSTRLWVEILDPGTNISHDMTQEHYVKQIVIFDEHGNEIASQGFRYDMEARLIAQVDIPTEAEQIYVYSECNLHGWWLSVYSTSDLRVAPVGDTRRAYTRDRPGEWADLAAKHIPIFGTRPDGTFSIEIGDRNDGLHVMTDQHYMSWILIYDDYSQMRGYVELSPSINPEPVFDFQPIGAKYLRILTYCNLHGWWEDVYSLSASESTE